eukprot:932604-Pyramimonas_sp.AAC.1
MLERNTRSFGTQRKRVDVGTRRTKRSREYREHIVFVQGTRYFLAWIDPSAKCLHTLVDFSPTPSEIAAGARDTTVGRNSQCWLLDGPTAVLNPLPETILGWAAQTVTGFFAEIGPKARTPLR